MAGTARIFRIDRLNTHNGQGFRTVIYFKGCPLHCLWCHNPEGMKAAKEVWLLPVKCIKCGECVQNCRSGALSMASGGLAIDRPKCRGCYACASVCPAKAIEKIGEDYTVDEVFEIVRQDQVYFGLSGGGLTVTGGEPGIYADFVSGLFQKCRKERIHSAFDTSGSIPVEALESIIPFTDMVFLDFKIGNAGSSLNHTGLDPEKVKDTLRWIQNFRKTHDFPTLQIRTPLIPGATDSDENLLSIGSYILKEYPDLVELWEWCMFNDLCEDKYRKLNKNWIYKGQKYTSDDFQHFSRLKPAFPDLKIGITGFYETR